MFQFSLKILLAVLMFVDLTFTVPIEDFSNHSTKSRQVTITADTGNVSHENEHVNKTDQVNNKKESLKDVDKNVTFVNPEKTSSNEEASTRKSVTLQNSSPTPKLEKKKDDRIDQNLAKRPVEETTPINQITEIKNASGLIGEQKDLVEGSSVFPRDEEDVTTIASIQNKLNTSVSNVTEDTSSTTLKSVKEITVPDIPVQKAKHNETINSNEHDKHVPVQKAKHNETINSNEHDKHVPVQKAKHNETINSNEHDLVQKEKHDETIDSKSTIQKEKHNNETMNNEKHVPVKNEKDNNDNIDSEHKKNVINATNTNTSESINVTTETASSNETSKSTEVTTTVVSSKNDQVEVESSTMTIVKKEKEEVKHVELKSKPLSANKEDSSMPAGIIVLVTALSFAVAIVIGYISMIVWKQYLEHRYGRRELLVNELEFDTNDLRHFEL